MDFSVALYGHYKADPTGVDLKRAQPGDLIAWKHLKDAYKWTHLERKLFLIVTILDIELSQMEALCECEYDLDSYKEYETPLSYEAWSTEHYPNMPVKDKEKKYITYTNAAKIKCELPTKYWMKRRFNISITELESKGVSLLQMLDKTLIYDSGINLIVTELYDKLKQRKVTLSDSISWLIPRTIEEIIENKSAETILSEIKD